MITELYKEEVAKLIAKLLKEELTKLVTTLEDGQQPEGLPKAESEEYFGVWVSLVTNSLFIAQVHGEIITVTVSEDEGLVFTSAGQATAPSGCFIGTYLAIDEEHPMVWRLADEDERMLPVEDWETEAKDEVSERERTQIEEYISHGLTDIIFARGW